MNNKKITLQTIYITVAILAIVYIVILVSRDLPISFESLKQIHKTESLFYFIDFLALIIIPSLLFYQNYRLSKIIKSQSDIAEHTQKLLEQDSNLTEELISGNLDFSATIEEDDNLGNLLMQLRKKLYQNDEEDCVRKLDDDRRSWATEGQSMFAEILRTNTDLHVLSYAVISNLVKYLDANQGGFFLFQRDEEKDIKESYFELMACYAYERRRMREKKIAWGEGLVGRCAIEKDIIFLTDIPDNYVHITSGLGQDTPKCLLLVPMINNDEVLGVFEIASFKVFPDYQIDFIKRIAEVTASTIAAVKINLKTADLLHESQLQGERLKRQEEEMRQNMDEMKKIQKDAAKQSEEFISFSNSVNHTMIRADYDVKGTLIYANTKFLSKLEYKSNAEVEGQNILKFIHEKDQNWFNTIWDKLSKGGKHYEGFMKLISRNNNDVWTLSTYTCVKNELGNVNKILFLAIDTTENKKQSLNYEGIISALNRSSLKAEFDLEGKITECNSNFLSHLEYTMDEILQLSIYDIADSEEHTTINEIWNSIKNVPFDGLLKYQTKEKAEKWFFGTFSPVKDMYGEVSKVIFIGMDYTKHEIVARQSERQNQILIDQEAQLQENQVLLEQKMQEAKVEMEKKNHELELSKTLFSKTLENLSDAIFTINKLGEIIFFNSAAEKLWEFSKAEIIGKNIKMLFDQATMDSNEFVAKLVDLSVDNFIGKRQKTQILTKNDGNKDVSIILSVATHEKEFNITAFVQFE